MKKKSMLFAATSLMIALAGCSSGKSATGTGDTPAGASAVKHDPVELVFWYPYPQDWSQEKFMETFGDPIHKKYPYITVKYIVGATKGTSLPELAAAGQTVDVVAASIGATPPTLLDAGLQYDITPLIKKHGFDTSKLDPAMVDIGKQLANGGMYGLPVYVPPSTIYYNKDLFDKFGIGYPKDGMTWDDIYELSKKLTRNEGGVQYYGFGSSYNHTLLLNEQSIPLVDTKSLKSTYDTDLRWKPFIENFVRMYKIPGYENLKSMSEPNERNQFFKDRTFAMFSALTALEPAASLNGLNWDLTSYPVFKDKPDVGPQAYPAYFYISTTSKYKDDAFDAISYLTSDEFQLANSKAATFVPASPNAAVLKAFGQDNPLYKGKNIQALKPKKYAISGSVNKYNPMASGKVDLKSVISKGLDINEALRAAAEAVNKTIKDTEAK